MYKFAIVILVVYSLWACTTQKAMTGKGVVPPQVVKDSTEYVLIVIDPGFEQWYILHYSPVLDRPNELYASANGFAVIKWNYYFTDGKYRRVIDSYIDYTPGIDYGIDLNRKLYWYFSYVEEKYRISLLK